MVQMNEFENAQELPGEGYFKQDLKTMVLEMKTLQAIKADQEERLKATNARLDVLRLKLIPEVMAEEDIRTITIEGIGRVQLAMDLYASIKDKEQGYQWLADHGYDGIIQPYVQPSTFKATVKEAIKAGQEFPDELFNITPFTRASIVKV